MTADVITLDLPKSSPAQQLRKLRERAGYARDRLAPLLGFASGSSLQRYELDRHFGRRYLPLNLVLRLIPLLEGRGAPPIRRREITALAGVDTARDGSSNHFEKTYRAALGMLEALIANNLLDLPPAKVTPIALAIAQRASGGGSDGAEDCAELVGKLGDLHRAGNN